MLMWEMTTKLQQWETLGLILNRGPMIHFSFKIGSEKNLQSKSRDRERDYEQVGATPESNSTVKCILVCVSSKKKLCGNLISKICPELLGPKIFNPKSFPQRRDNAGAVCDSSMGMLFLNRQILSYRRLLYQKMG